MRTIRNQDNSKFGGECMAGKRRILQRILQTKDSTNEGFYKRNEGFYKQPTTRSDFPEPQALAQKLVALLKALAQKLVALLKVSIPNGPKHVMFASLRERTEFFSTPLHDDTLTVGGAQSVFPGVFPT
ncbi:unnamed protein product [Cyprideis torosa]|uniref:Uncharacterized protein n=1 Tax=Cyprideis torosa TaxID=163714 RepID=A0A7R8WNM7_9CRUS|nr:unnamed protein product [Cyprideis torosa]CAG0904899.1 unnamed protein product [Cyprideis torosa]